MLAEAGFKVGKGHERRYMLAKELHRGRISIALADWGRQGAGGIAGWESW